MDNDADEEQTFKVIEEDRLLKGYDRNRGVTETRTNEAYLLRIHKFPVGEFIV